jgi:N-sulfoglucosamine sulfohydrolase
MPHARLASVVLAFILMLPALSVADERPNILWITSEDNNVQWVGCYGNPNGDTPRIDEMAGEGFRYTHCFANTPVCSPQRSVWITGIHAVSMGTHPMRSRYDIPHNLIRYYPDELRAAGYFSLKPGKTDCNIGGRDDREPWDKGQVDFKTLKDKQPFFSIINIGDSHESRAHGDVENTQHDPAQVKLAPYHPDLPVIRKNYAKYQDAVKRMDSKVGQVLDDLAASGLHENTVVIYNSDHGGVMARSKRFLVDTGIHCPLIVRIPPKFKSFYPAETPGMAVNRILSFIDMPKTWLALAGAKIPAEMQGHVFLGPSQDTEREFHVAYRGRMDERCDNSRAVRDKQFLYIRNFMPYVPRGQYLTYLWHAQATKAWEAHHRAGKTDAVTGRFFRNKPVEELYDTTKDPYSINNLAGSDEHQEVLENMRGRLRQWQAEHYDAAMLPEAEMVTRAQKYKTTIYEMVRDPKKFPIAKYLEASDIALAKSADNRQSLESMLASEDSGVRYWGSVGLFLLGEQATDSKPALRKALGDDCHEVVAMAAWSLFNLGEKETGRSALRGLLENNSYAALKVANVIGWMGEGYDFYRPALLSCKTSVQDSYLARIKKTVQSTTPQTK